MAAAEALPLGPTATAIHPASPPAFELLKSPTQLGSRLLLGCSVPRLSLVPWHWVGAQEDMCLSLKGDMST